MKVALARLATSRVAFVTLIATVDGSVFLLAAQGVLSTWTGAALTGLLVVAGVGSWIAARHEYGRRPLGREEAVSLALLGVLLVGLTCAAAALGAALGEAAGDMPWVRLGGGIILALFALEVAGATVPRVGKMPLALVVLAAALGTEAIARWSP